MKRGKVLLVVAILAASMPVGAASARGQDSSAPHADRVRIAIAGYENNLRPFAITFQSEITVNLVNMVYDTLFYSPYDMRPEPWLAEDFKVSNDARTWTIDIRNGVRWHDGRPLTAEDVRFTYEYFFNHQQGLYSHHVNDLPFVEEFELVDNDTVRFTCREPCPTFNIDPGSHIPIIPKHVWKDVEDPAKFTKGLPVGSGPYKVVDIVPDQRYTLRANENYFRGRPLADEIVMPIIPESSAMFLALKSGEVDAVSRIVPPQAISSLKDAGLAIVKQPAYKSVQINFNVQREPFDSTAFRNALNLAVETAPITKTLLAGRGQPGVESFLDPDSPFAVTQLKDRYNTDRARRLLDELGFRDRDGNGVRERPNGGALHFEILVSSNEAREVRASELVSDQLAEVGVRAEVVPLDPVTLNERRQPPSSGEVDVPETEKTGNYDMYVSSYGGHFHFDPDGLLYIFHCPGETGFGAYITGYCNKEFDRLVEKAATLGFQERIPVLQEAQRVLYNDPPAISLYFPQGTHAYRPQAYTGWVPETGHGIVHKRSFLPGEDLDRVDAATTAGESDGGGVLAWPFVVVGLIVLGGGALLITTGRRRRRAAAGQSQGPEVD